MRDYPTEITKHAETAGSKVSTVALAGAIAAAIAEPTYAWGFVPKNVKRGDTVPAGLYYEIDAQSGKKTARLFAEIPTGNYAATMEAQTQWADAYIKLLVRELSGGDDATRRARKFVGDAKSNREKLKTAAKSRNATPRLKKALQLAKYQNNEHFKPPKIKDTDFYTKWRARFQKAIDTDNIDEIKAFVTLNGGKLQTEKTMVSAARRLLRS